MMAENNQPETDMKPLTSRLLSSLALLVLSSASAFAASCDPVNADEAVKAEDARYEAQMNNDFAAMNSLLSDDLVYFHSSAVIDNKQTYIDSLRSGAVRYRVMRRSDVNVRTYGCVAMLTGNGNFDVTVNGKDLSVQIRFHSIWQKKDGVLQFVSWQATRIP
jgi:ketosteroid isomerase-like protein